MKRLLVLLLLASAPLAPAQQQDVDARLREALKNTTLQLRAAQGEAGELRLAKDLLETEKADLAKKLEQLIKQGVADQEAADQTRGELRAMIDRQDGDIVKLNDALGKWKAAYGKAADLAQKKETERAKLAATGIELQRRVEDAIRRNLEMYKLGIEVLRRYERFGLGTAITAREPFTGITRVKLQNLVQDYSDALADQRVAPPAPTTTSR